MSHQEVANFFTQLPKDKRERASTLRLEYLTLEIRTVIEQTRAKDLSPEEKVLISNVYGQQVTYKCPKIWCDYFSVGFYFNEHRHKHVDSHERPFRCPNEGCFAFRLGHSSKIKLEEHTKKYHSPVGEEVRFPKVTRPRDNDTLLEAAGRNDLAAMLAFLESGAAVEGTLTGASRQYPENRIPICSAAKKGHPEACKLLLKWGAKSRGSDGYSPMFHAIEHNHPNVVHCLLSWPTVGSKEELSKWIDDACKRAQPDTVRMLLESSHFRSRGIEEWKPYAAEWIRGACRNSVHDSDNVEIVNFLLEQGFSDSVRPDVVSDIKNRGGEYLASLLQPIIDHRAFSDTQAREQTGRLGYEHRGYGNKTSQGWQTQLDLLEQQNKKMLMMSRQK